MKVVPIITNLTGGEMTPLLAARVDFKKYANGCEELQNFIVRAQGGGTKRSGTIYANEVENSGARARGIPFVFSTVQAYFLEFGEDEAGNGYMRPWKHNADGSYGVITSGGVPVKIASPYKVADLETLQYTQTADVLYLFHSGHSTQKLTRTSHTAWDIEPTEWGSKMTALPAATATAKGSTGSTAYEYQLTVKDATGNESLPVTASLTNGNATLSTSNYNELAWASNAAPSTAVEVCAYRGYDGIFKYIGNASPSKKKFKDTGQDYDSTITPPIANNPFTSNGGFPRCGSFHQDRLYMGGTDNHPQTIYGSRAGDHENLNLSRPAQDADFLQLTLLSNEVSLIKWMVPGRKVFMLGTAGACWVLKSSEGSAITPTNVEASPEVFTGCNNMRALPIGSVLLFVDSFGRQVLEFAYELASDGYVTPDLTVLAEHLTRDNKLEEWAYAKSPHRLVFCVRDDGVAPVLTYYRDHEVVGWWRFVTDGEVESVVSIPGVDRDEIWLIVKRTIMGQTKRYVEVLAPTFSNDTTCEDAFFMDCGATLDNWNPEDTAADARRLRVALASESGTWAGGDAVYLHSSNAGSGASFNIGYASNVGRYYCLRNDEGLISRVLITGVEALDQLSGKLDAALPTELQNVATANFARMVTSLSGLTWLAGKEVDLVGDGKVLTPKVVTYDGRVSLTQPCAKVHVGLHYDAYITPHALEAGFPDGTSVGRTARISKVGLSLYQTFGLKVGPKGGTASPVNFSTGTERMGAALTPFSGDIDVAVESSWGPSPKIRIVHDIPMPCTVLAIVPRIHGTGA